MRCQRGVVPSLDLHVTSAVIPCYLMTCAALSQVPWYCHACEKNEGHHATAQVLTKLTESRTDNMTHGVTPPGGVQQLQKSTSVGQRQLARPDSPKNDSATAHQGLCGKHLRLQNNVCQCGLKILVFIEQKQVQLQDSMAKRQSNPVIDQTDSVRKGRYTGPIGCPNCPPK